MSNQKSYGSSAVAATCYRVERRDSRRFEVAWEVVVEEENPSGNELWLKPTLANISSTGAYLRAGFAVKTGAKLRISIRVPLGNKSWMSYTAEVTRVEKLDTENGIAVRFQSSRPTFAGR